MSTRRLLSVSAAALAAGLLAADPAAAACTVSATPVAFGTYDVFAATPLDSTGSVTYRCEPRDRNITITLDAGGGGSFSARRMSGAGDTLRYNLYLDAARTTVFGDGTGGTALYSDRNPPGNRDVTVTVYGRIPAGQDVSAGIYTDVVTVTINF